MSITLYDKEIYKRLKFNIKSAKDSIVLMSAYCKQKTFEEINRYVRNTVKEKVLVVRFQYMDVISGASDLGVYEVCKNYGWKLYFNLRTHAKTYVFDQTHCINGSANLTGKGMGLVAHGNMEYATEYDLEKGAYKKIMENVEQSVLITDKIYEKMLCSLKKSQEKNKVENWDKEILILFHQPVTSIFTCELPHQLFDMSLCDHELDFLCFHTKVTEENMKEAFQNSKCYQWLITQLEQAGNREMYFGELVARLHYQVVNEPKPYRKDVKELLANLLDWTNQLASDKVRIDVPGHSTRVKQIKE